MKDWWALLAGVGRSSVRIAVIEKARRAKMTMRRVDGKGTCEHCGSVFPYEIVHNGFNDSTSAYCDRCGTTAVLNLVGLQKRLVVMPKLVVPISAEIENLLLPCACGGQFRGDAPARCPTCGKALSAQVAAKWMEQNAPGAQRGWRWQRTWAGLYALIIAEKVVFDPWKD